jgi:hypothetical protein
MLALARIVIILSAFPELMKIEHPRCKVCAIKLFFFIFIGVMAYARTADQSHAPQLHPRS